MAAPSRKTITGSIYEALGGMTEESHNDLKNGGWTSEDGKTYSKEGIDLPANKARDIERAERKGTKGKQSPVATPS